MATPPDAFDSADLIALAFDLLEVAERSRSGAHLRRAVSTAYYAMFHCLARLAADRLIRNGSAPERTEVWRHVYRSLQHRHAKAQCRNSKAMALHPDVIRHFAGHFAARQDERHRADYDPAASFDRADVRKSIHSTAENIRLLEEASEADQAAFAAWVLTGRSQILTSRRAAR